MPNAIDQRLASRLAQQKIKLLAQSERAAVNVGRVYDALLRDLLALATGDGVTDSLARDAREAAERASVAARETLRQDLVASVQASRKATIATLLDTVPLRWFRAIAPELAVLPLPEGLQERAVDDPEFGASYDFEPIAQRRLTREQAMALIRELAFPPLSPEAVEAYLDGGPGGISWDERLRYWDSQARDQMLSQLTQGVSAGESVVELRKRLQPITDGVRWKAQRVARTEARRVAERSQVDTYAEMGDMIEAMQVIASLDQWTRPAHAARHGKTYRRQADGGFVADDGEVLPDLPDAPNCRCYASPILATPAEFLKDPVLRADFSNAQAEVIPDPAAYVQWFDRAPEKERALAVGVRRYRAVERKLSGTGQRPEWPDFIDQDGKLLTPQKIVAETADKTAERKQAVEATIARREQMYQDAAAKGMVAPTPKPVAKPEPPPKPAKVAAMTRTEKEEAKTAALRQKLADMKAANQARAAELARVQQQAAEKRAELDSAQKEKRARDAEAARLRAKIDATDRETKRIDRKLKAEDKKRDRTTRPVSVRR